MVVSLTVLVVWLVHWQMGDGWDELPTGLDLRLCWDLIWTWSRPKLQVSAAKSVWFHCVHTWSSH